MTNVAQSSCEPGRQIPTRYFKVIRHGTRITIRFGAYFKVLDSASFDGLSSSCGIYDQEKNTGRSESWVVSYQQEEERSRSKEVLCSRRVRDVEVHGSRFFQRRWYQQPYLPNQMRSWQFQKPASHRAQSSDGEVNESRWRNLWSWIYLVSGNKVPHE